MKKKRNGFTLVELMVVIVIMAILAAASVPVFSGYIRKAKASGHLTECRAIYMAVQTYLEEVRISSENGALELSDVETDDMLWEVKALTGIDDIGEGENGQESRGLSETYYIQLDNSEDEVVCSAVIYNGGKEGVWIFDTQKGSYTEKK